MRPWPHLFLASMAAIASGLGFLLGVPVPTRDQGCSNQRSLVVQKEQHGWFHVSDIVQNAVRPLP